MVYAITHIFYCVLFTCNQSDTCKKAKINTQEVHFYYFINSLILIIVSQGL